MEDEDSVEETQIKSALAEEVSIINNEWVNKWGWLDLCRKVSEYLHTSFFIILEERTVFEVLTISTMMLEDIERKSIKSNANGKEL